MPNPVNEARTVEGALARVDAETVVSDSIDTDQATINGQQEQDPRKLLKYIEITNGNATISETVSGLDGDDPNFYYIIEILSYVDVGSGDNPLTATFGGVGNGNYDYTMVDELGNFRGSTGNDSVELLTPTASTPNDILSGTFRLIVRNRPMMCGMGAPGLKKEGESLHATRIGEQVNNSFDLTLEADIGSSGGEIVAAVWQVQDRSAI